MKWFNYAHTHTHTHMHAHIYSVLFHYGLLQDIEYSSLCYRVGTCCLFILYIVVYICYSQTHNSSFPLSFSLWSPWIRFLRLWVCFCFTNMFISIFKIPHISYTVFNFLFLPSFSVIIYMFFRVTAMTLFHSFFMAEQYSIIYITHMYK